MNSMGCVALSYSSMVESNAEASMWEKRTIEYMVENYDKIRRTVAMMATGFTSAQVDHIMSDLAIYLRNANDYDIEKAYNEEIDSYLSLESYINIGIKYCIQRYRSNVYKDAKYYVQPVKTDDSGEKSVLDDIPDNSATVSIENIDDNIDIVLDSLQGIRYKYQVDIYLITYLRILIGIDTECNKEDIYLRVLRAISISKKDLADAEKKISKDQDVMTLMRIICISAKSEEIIEKLEKYVYGHKIIRRTIESMMRD